MKTLSIRIYGMTCATCASHVKKTLEKGGAEDVSVNFATGDTTFRVDEKTEKKLPRLVEEIGKLGYTVAPADLPAAPVAFCKTTLFRLLFCACFTLPLLLHMAWPDSALADPRLQFLLSLPVYLAGLVTFGRPALRSLLHRMPDMNVLILLGATAAWAYSLAGMTLHAGHAHRYLFFESSASIITLVLAGRYIEERVVKKTSSSIADLVRLQKTTAWKILFNRRAEKIVAIDNSLLQVGDRVLINAGDQVPADGCITWGEATVNEAMLTGESEPVYRRRGDTLTGGAHLESGAVKMRVTAVGRDTALAHIVELVRRAQNEKTGMQQLADRVSAVFVPAVLLAALATFCAWRLLAGVPFVDALMYAVSVTVIACPCAMGLATPLALMVGMGRAAGNGILIRGMRPLEACTRIRQIAFDKTGTLTTGEPTVAAFASLENREDELKSLALALEKHSSHPVARCIATSWEGAAPVEMAGVTELRGKGVTGFTAGGDAVFIGAADALKDAPPFPPGHSLYVARNGEVIGWIDLQEKVRLEAREVVEQLKRLGIRPAILSGDREGPCRTVAREVGIETVFAGQTPERKQATLKEMMRTAPTAMVGDGINDAPALATAHLGISLSDASRIAVQQADMLLLDASLKRLPLALALGKHTFVTIRENLFWAFIYNAIAIPVAAFGLLTPTVAAASMALSNVFLLANSMRLKFKKVI
ncbi:MAG: cadmium-translocating P-type ATPase [Tannerella sp.]|nr:cadmium-translocating P-type ATPase [Tannerella sp.]